MRVDASMLAKEGGRPWYSTRLLIACFWQRSTWPVAMTILTARPRNMISEAG